MRRRDQQLFEFKCFFVGTRHGPWTEVVTRATGGCSALLRSGRWTTRDGANLRPHWPLSTVKKLHIKYKRDMPLVRDVTTTVAQSLSEDARASLAAFLDENPEASVAEVARHSRAEHRVKCHRTPVWRAMKQLFTPFQKVTCQKISAVQSCCMKSS